MGKRAGGVGKREVRPRRPRLPCPPPFKEAVPNSRVEAPPGGPRMGVGPCFAAPHRGPLPGAGPLLCSAG